MFDGGETVTVLVLVLVLTLVLTDVLTLGSVVVVVVGDSEVSVDVEAGAVVSVTVPLGPTCGADVVVVAVVLVVAFVESDEPDIRLTTNHTISASMSAMIAPNATRAAGLRYQGASGSGGGPGC